MNRYEPHCVCLGGHVSMRPDPNGRWCRAATYSEMELVRDEGWQDISTAPRNGRRVLVWGPDFQTVTEAWFCEETGLWPRDSSHSDEGEPCNVGLPSHWRPLPEPPTHITTEADHA